MKHFAVLLSAALAGGCGTAARGVTAEPVDSGGSGGSGGGPTSAGMSPGGTAPVGGGGQRGTGGPLFLQQCNVGAMRAPLVRYSSVDLEWTMQELFGEAGGPLPFGYSDRADQGEARSANVAFAESLLAVATARAALASIDESRLQPCAAEDVESASCLDGWLQEYGLALYRRPLAAEQLAGYREQFQANAQASSALAAARQVLVSMLLSPYFVFRIELGQPYAPALLALPPQGIPQPPITFDQGQAIDAFEVAARLSHFLTRSAPDTLLLQSAASNELLTPEGLAAQARRLQAAPGARRAGVRQQLEWLHLEDFQVEAISPELRADMAAQTALFIDDVLTTRSGSLFELLTSPRQPLNRALAEHYQLSAEVGDELELVDLDPLFHAGVLGQGAWLARNPRPTFRGRTIFADLLCSPPPPPPPNVPLDGFVGDTPRERISNATADAPCRTCHSIFEGPGFALEAFDEVGRLSGYETTGSLRLPSALEPASVSGPAELGQKLADSVDIRVCAARHYVEQLLEYQLDDPNLDLLLECLITSFYARDLDLNHLALEVAVSSVMGRMTREPVNVIASSRASDPLQHAAEELDALINALSPPETQRLQEYLQSLVELQGRKSL